MYADQINRLPTVTRDFYIYISDSFYKSQEADVIMTDFTKAFNTVDYHLIGNKLEFFGFCDP